MIKFKKYKSIKAQKKQSNLNKFIKTNFECHQIKKIIFNKIYLNLIHKVIINLIKNKLKIKKKLILN